MPATVVVNFMTVVHKASNGTVMVFPDVCKTPTPGGPVPIPYPNIAMSSDTANGTKTVKCDGQPIMIKSSFFMTSTGDEAGSALGVVSNRIKGKAYPKMYSFDVKADGENVFRLADIMLMNGASPTNTPPSPEMQPPNGGLGNSQKPSDRKIVSVKWNQADAACGDQVKIDVKTENLAGKVILLDFSQKPGVKVESGTVGMTGEHITALWTSKAGPWRKNIDLEVKASGYGKPAVSPSKLKIKLVPDVATDIISQQRLTPQYVQVDVQKIVWNGWIPSIVTVKEWQPNGRNYGWDMTYARRIRRGILIITKKVDFDFKDGARLTKGRRKAWVNEIESIWNKKWKLHRKQCKRGAACNCPHGNACCVFPIRIRCRWGGGHGKKVELNKGACDPGGWGTARWWYSHTWWESRAGVGTYVRAHEFGHLIGMYDEYPAGACDPARQFTNEPSSIMNLGANTYERHMKDFHAWFQTKAGSIIGETDVLRI